MPASQNSLSRSAMLIRISSRTLLSQPGGAALGRFRAMSQTDDAKDARRRFLRPPGISVAMGQDAVTQKPARIIEETNDSQASGYLCAKTTTNLPESRSDSLQDLNARNMPS